jgi:hypothetical protein
VGCRARVRQTLHRNFVSNFVPPPPSPLACRGICILAVPDSPAPLGILKFPGGLNCGCLIVWSSITPTQVLDGITESLYLLRRIHNKTASAAVSAISNVT